MDPERTSLLVAKLLTDIVPGDLAVVRLLDLSKDGKWLPSKDTGQTMPCSEDPSRTCHHVIPTSDWDKDVRTYRYGAEVRPARGDAGYKHLLDSHLSQVINNSLFGLGFRAAQGVFDQHPGSTARRMVIWLSDGTTDDEQRLHTTIEELQSSGAKVEAVVFGKGTTTVAHRLGLEARQVRNPGELMRAFAGAFRRVVDAPYELDSLVSANPTFIMKPNVDEAWVVVYGDDTLGDVSIDSPGGARNADYAQDRFQGAGAYRVLYVQKPLAGRWTVHLAGGGPHAAYAVVQRSTLTPILLEPPEPRVVTAGIPVKVVAGIGHPPAGPVLSPTDFPDPIEIELTVDGKSYRLTDDGTGDDAVAHDGRFSGTVTFDSIGEVVASLHARSTLIDRTVDAKFQVTGVFHYRGGPISLNLGTVTAGSTPPACRDFTLVAEHTGAVPFELRQTRDLPPRVQLEFRTPKTAVRPPASGFTISPNAVLNVCLSAERRAGAFEASGQQWLELDAAGARTPDGRVPIQLTWQVRPLSFWELWGWLILSILLILLVLFWIYGFIKPIRFQRNLALIFVPERDEIEEQSPQPISQWKGVGISWYRDARAYLHGSFRVSSNSRGSLASLHAVAGGTRVRAPGALFRETTDGEWESVSPEGRRAISGEVFRIGESGPYFKISVRRA
jgi:hypothetical protein